MTYQENETTEACDSRKKKVSDGSLASRPKARGMMATWTKPLKFQPNNQGWPHKNNQRRDHERGFKPKEKLAKAKKLVLGKLAI